jgi:hypothetical protein
MESKFNRLFWLAWCSNFDLEKFNDNFFEYLLKEFGLFTTKTYKHNINNDTIPTYSQSFILENGQFSFSIKPESKWCSISLIIPYNEDFDIIKFKNDIKIGLNAEKIEDTLELTYIRKNI